ncbi:hypothetical protein CEUSTIGMA_g13697.t1 [Chlamydomonas eustigma]|uniref:Uncharacterized protein n=1 Tax=Chlamydomonas eustigma TaxID=1157962 RepID=A0A250XTA0_9CHLO|nr:hypothetical protein CEUSTIGMA_g13697.t1 [Chlamydomonas eustigma]|eukprot:GAX86285.1 hypothetical protein CEUSTIGMA_g13697.t1 [Chlamydomonas eustigma]
MASAHASKWVKDRFDAFSDKDGFYPTMPGLVCQTLEFFQMTLELGEYKGRVVYEAFEAKHREASGSFPQNSGVPALTHQPQLKIMSDHIDGNGIMNEHRAVALYNSRKNCSGGYIKEKAKEMMLVKKPRVTYEMLTKKEENVPVLNKIVNEVLKIDGFPTLDILQ